MRMGTLLLNAILILGTVSQYSKLVSANDTLVGESAGGFVVLTEHPLRMVNEHIVAESETGTQWEVDALYTFENPTDERFQVTMAFPERSLCHYAEGDHDPGFVGLVVTVDGNRVPVRPDQITLPSRDAHGEVTEGSSPCTVPAHLFEVTFEPQERLAVRHRYTVGATRDSMFFYFRYVTRTGAYWDGPIEEARFDITIHGGDEGTTALPSCIYETEFDDVTVTEVELNGEFRRTWSFVQRDWTPRGDLNISWFDRHVQGNCGRPGNDSGTWLTFVEGGWQFDEAAFLRDALTHPEQLAEAIIDVWVAHGFITPFDRARLLWSSTRTGGYAAHLCSYGHGEDDRMWNRLPDPQPFTSTRLYPEERACVQRAWEAIRSSEFTR